MTATPRPWTIKKIVNRTHPTADVWIDDENGNPVMITDPDKAALIVRAVNSHDALLEAASTLALVHKGILSKSIKDATIMDTSNPTASSYPKKPLSQIIEEKLTAVSAALKLAKGET